MNASQWKTLLGRHRLSQELPHAASLGALVGISPGLGHDGRGALRMMSRGQEQGPVSWEASVTGLEEGLRLQTGRLELRSR